MFHRHEICCASNAALKIVKITIKNQSFLFNKIKKNYPKVQIKKKRIFLDSANSSCHFDYLFNGLRLININVNQYEIRRPKFRIPFIKHVFAEHLLIIIINSFLQTNVHIHV